jgi:hypothetical protein
VGQLGPFSSHDLNYDTVMFLGGTSTVTALGDEAFVVGNASHATVDLFAPSGVGADALDLTPLLAGLAATALTTLETDLKNNVAQTDLTLGAATGTTGAFTTAVTIAVPGAGATVALEGATRITSTSQLFGALIFPTG